MQSGISVSDELLGLYEEIKLRHKHKYVIFSLKPSGSVGGKASFDWSIDFKAEPVPDDKNKDAFTEMVGKLPADEARFVVFDFADVKADGRQIKKLVLIKWYVPLPTVKCLDNMPLYTPVMLMLLCFACRCPDSTHFRVKTVIGGTYQTLKEKLSGLGKDVQAADPADLSYEAIKASLA